MTQSQQTLPPRRCPRCGGLMAKPSGSNLYWHADNNHPRCDITNIADASSLLRPVPPMLSHRAAHQRETIPKNKTFGDVSPAVMKAMPDFSLLALTPRMQPAYYPLRNTYERVSTLRTQVYKEYSLS